jgi:hypothetical protein
MVPLQRNTRVRLSIVQNANFATCSRSITRQNYVALQNSIVQAMATVMDITRHIAVKTTIGRVPTTVIVAPIMTNARRNRRTSFLPIAVTRHSSPAPQSNLQGVLQEPKNQDKRQVNNKKCQHELHHNDARYTSDDDELRASVDTLVPSEDQTSFLSEDKINKDENYHLHMNKILKAGCRVLCKSDHQQHRSKSKLIKRAKRKRRLLHSWMMISFLQTPS